MMLWNLSTLKINIQVRGHFMFVWLQMTEYPSYADDVVQIQYVWCF